jgi:hypothetical protein
MLDNCCLVAAQEPLDPRHVDCLSLIELGRSERLVLLVATGISYDLENASEERRGVREEWLRERPFIGSVPGPFIVGVTRIGSDAMVPEGLREPLARLNEIMAVGTKSTRRQMIDHHQVVAAVMQNVAAFVTFDPAS